MALQMWLLVLVSLPASRPLAHGSAPLAFLLLGLHQAQSPLRALLSPFPLSSSFQTSSHFLQASVPPSLLQRGLPTILSDSNIPFPTPCFSSFIAPATAQDYMIALFICITVSSSPECEVPKNRNFLFVHRF